MSSDLSQLSIDRSKPRRRRPANPWPARAIGLGIAAITLWLFWNPVRNWVDSVRLPAVEVLRVRETDAASVGAVRGAAANGYITAARRAALSADAPGRIVEMLVTEGSVVERGQVVARLFSDDYRAAVARARAERASAEAAVESARARAASTDSALESERRSCDAQAALVEDAKAALTLADAQLGRERELLEGGISSQDDVDLKQERYDRARAQLRAAESRLLSSDARVADLEQQQRIGRADLTVAETTVGIRAASLDEAVAILEKTEVRAPFDGIVVLKDAEVGEVVSPNSQGGSNARGSVCTLVDFASLEAQADVPERNLARVRVGAAANVYVDAFPERTYPARVDRIWPTADRSKSTVEVRVKFEALDRDLRPDMGVRIVFLEEPEPDGQAVELDGILIPRDAIVEQDGASWVFVLERDRVKLTQVRTGAERGRRILVEAGLDAGQTIVLAPPTDLSDGDRVRVVES